MTMSKKSQTWRTIPLLITICFFNFPAYAKYNSGTGEPNDPYQIATAEDLMLLGGTPEDYDKHFILTNDIDLDPNLFGRKVFDKAVIAADMNDSNWEFDGTPFIGVFDGGGHTISHLTISGTDYLGLFGRLGSGAEVRNLGVADVNITGSGGDVGGLAGEKNGAATACYSTGRVRGGRYYIGGLVGYNRDELTQCYSDAEVIGRECVGGLVGDNKGNAANCHSTGAVTGSGDYAHVGGLAGINSGRIINCCSTGAVKGTVENSDLVFPNIISGVGGLVGENSGMVTVCYGKGEVTATEVLSASSWTGHRSSRKVTGVGGLVGHNYVEQYYIRQGASGSVTNSFATGSVNGDADVDYVGGLVGSNSATAIVLNCYSTGKVTGSTSLRVGGLVGEDSGHVSSSFYDANSFYDAEKWRKDAGAGGAGIGLAEAKMKDPNAYLKAGWDFLGESANGTHEIWQMPGGAEYPELSAFRGYNPPQLLGSGTSDDPYLISTPAELGVVMWCDPKACYRLVGDIDLSAIRWSMPVISVLAGTFDGNHFTIHNLTIKGGGDLGLFGTILSHAQVRDLAVTDANVIGLGNCVGGLAGSNHGSVNSCHIVGTVTGDANQVGGLVGWNDGAVAQCCSDGTVRGTGVGHIGPPWPGQWLVMGGQYVGGLVGRNSPDREWVASVFGTPGDVNNSYSTSVVIGEDAVGGLVGYNIICSVNWCYSTGSVTARGKAVGGLVGDGTYPNKVKNSFWDTETSGCRWNSSEYGTGKTTAEMQTLSTFLDAGWDFVDEMANGTEDIWWISEGKDYPRLWWEDAEQ